MKFRSQILSVVFCGVFSAASVSALAADPAAESVADKPPAVDWGNFSATATLTTDYVLRGISQSNNDPAIQGSFDWYKGMFYAGIWASSVDFSPTKASTEVDLYAGITPSWGGVNFNFGALYYIYPDAGDAPGAEFNFFEVVGTAEYDFGMAKAKAIVYYTPDYFAESDEGLYIEGKLTVPLVGNLEASGSVAKQWVKNNVQFGAPDYLTWNAGLSYTWKQFTVDARYTDTDLSTAECFGGANLCSGRFVGTLSASF